MNTLKTIWPWAYTPIAAYLRYTMGMIFWLSAQAKVDGFTIKDSTFFLFKTEFNLPIIPPDIAAVLATVGEHAFSAMLLIGLGTRLGALGIFAMTAVIQIFVYPEEYLLHGGWMAMCLILVAFGPGKLSLDHLIAHFTGFNLWRIINDIRLKYKIKN